MKKITENLYIADDNTSFNSEKDCRTYEKNNLSILLKNKKFDMRFNPVENFSDAYYFILSNDKDIEDLHTLNKIYDIWFDSVDDVGIYYYDMNGEKYVNLSTIYQKILDLAY